MQASHKFLFEDCFDPTQPAEAEVEEEEIEPPPPTFSEEEIALARAQGFAEGRTEGIAEMQSSIDTRLMSLMEEMIRQITDLGSVQAAGMKAAEIRLLGLASTIARKVVPPIARDAAQAAVEDLVRDCLPKLMDEPRVVIRVHATVMDQLRDRVDTLAAKSGFAGDIILLPEEEFMETDCRVEWADGGAESSSAALWADIDKTLDTFLPATPEPAPDTENEADNPSSADTARDDTTIDQQPDPAPQTPAAPGSEFPEENLNG